MKSPLDNRPNHEDRILERKLEEEMYDHLNISGTLAIGNGEKCPYCELIIEENIDTIEHMKANHEKELLIELFGEEK